MTYRAYLVPAEQAKYAAIVADLHAKLFPRIVFPYPHYGDWWVAWKDNTPVAFAHMAPTTYYPNSGYFGRVGVLPAHRGHGLQYRLMRAVERHARSAHQWDALYSDTTRVPHSAANFVRRKWVQFQPENPWGTKATIYWRKEL